MHTDMEVHLSFLLGCSRRLYHPKAPSMKETEKSFPTPVCPQALSRQTEPRSCHSLHSWPLNLQCPLHPEFHCVCTGNHQIPMLPPPILKLLIQNRTEVKGRTLNQTRVQTPLGCRLWGFPGRTLDVPPALLYCFVLSLLSRSP